MLSLESLQLQKIFSLQFQSGKLFEIHNKSNFVADSWQDTFSVSLSESIETNIFIDDETSKCLKRMSDAIDTWAEYIRVDPSDLVLDEPYNNVIFQQMVRIISLSDFYLIKGSNTFSSDEEYAEALVVKALEMALALRHIAQYYFNEAEVGSPYISILIEIDYQFISACEDLIKIFRALKHKLRYNYCFCNTINTC